MKTLLTILYFLLPVFSSVAFGNVLSYDAVSPRTGDRLNVFPVRNCSWSELVNDTVDISNHGLWGPFERQYNIHIDADSVPRICATENGTAKVIDTADDGSMWIRSIGTPGSHLRSYQYPHIVITGDVVTDTAHIDMVLGNDRRMQEHGISIVYPPVPCVVITWEGDTLDNCLRLERKYIPIICDTTESVNDPLRHPTAAVLTSQWFAEGYRYPILEASAISSSDESVQLTQCHYISPLYQAGVLAYDEVNDNLRQPVWRNERTNPPKTSRGNNYKNVASDELSGKTGGESELSPIFARLPGLLAVLNSGPTDIAVYSLNGMVWHQGRYDLSTGEQALTDVLTSLPEGEYIVVFSHEGESFTIKITTRCGVPAIYPAY